MSRLLVISPTPTHPRGAGNRARVETLLLNLIGSGHDVTFLHIEQEPGDRAAMRSAWGDRYHYAEYQLPDSLGAKMRRRWSRATKPSGFHNYRIDDWYDPGANDVIKHLHQTHQFEAVIVEYVFMSAALEQFDDQVLKLIDTHDMFTDRHQRYLDEGQKPQWFSTTAREEGKAFSRADHVIAITDKEREAFSRLTSTPVITVGHFVTCTTRDPAEICDGSMLFVASDNPINLHGIEWFVEEVLPGVRKKNPRAEVWVVGTVARSLTPQPGVKLLGRVEDLDEVYAQAQLVVNPVRFNTGLSIKNLEALAYGCPLVTAPVGTEGIEEGSNVSYLVADEACEWIVAVGNLLEDGQLAGRLSEQASRAAHAWNDNAIAVLNEALCRA